MQSLGVSHRLAYTSHRRHPLPATGIDSRRSSSSIAFARTVKCCSLTNSSSSLGKWHGFSVSIVSTLLGCREREREGKGKNLKTKTFSLKTFVWGKITLTKQPSLTWLSSVRWRFWSQLLKHERSFDYKSFHFLCSPFLVFHLFNWSFRFGSGSVAEIRCETMAEFYCFWFWRRLFSKILAP